jgi:hypothetical protein
MKLSHSKCTECLLCYRIILFSLHHTELNASYLKPLIFLQAKL